MKKFTFSLAKLALIPAVALMVLSMGACKKEQQLAPSAKTMTGEQKRAKMKENVVKILKDFSEANANRSSGGTWSSGISYTTYSTPTANVYVWSDPTTGTTFTFSESTGGGGLGQLSYDGTSVDYNYVLHIKAESEDPAWDGFFNGRDLRGAVAIKGDITDPAAITVENLSIFLVATEGGSGTYKFIDFDDTPGDADAIGQIIDLGSTPGSLASLDGGNIYITSGGHVDVSDASFEMQSDAKVMKLSTSVESTLAGMIMFE
jgi:hypothetical protein